jgi:hypothetical protein
MMRSLPPLGLGPAMENRAPSPLPPLPLGHDISRPSSTSTQSSALHLQQHHHHSNTTGVSLPALSTLAAVATIPSPPARCVLSHILNSP